MKLISAIFLIVYVFYFVKSQEHNELNITEEKSSHDNSQDLLDVKTHKDKEIHIEETDYERKLRLEAELKNSTLFNKVNQTLDENNMEDIMKEIEFDGLILKINEKIFEKIMKSVDYAMIWIDQIDDNEKCLTDPQCKHKLDLYSQFKTASTEVVKLTPPVALLSMKCNESPSFCDPEKQTLPFAL